MNKLPKGTMTFWEYARRLAVVILMVYFIWQVPQWLVTSSPEVSLVVLNEARQTLLHLLIGVIILIALYAVLRRMTILEKQIVVAHEGQITERFNRAIEQLCSYKLEIQLGGIFTLERIAWESEKDHWPIMEILTAHVREHAKYEENQRWNGKVTEIREPVKTSKPSTDIQAVLTVIGRRQWLANEVLNGKVLNLRKTNLAHLDLKGLNFSGVNLRGANLQRANLNEANMIGAFLAEANLRNANLTKANFRGAYLVGADMTGANLREVNLQGANLSKAAFDLESLVGAKLEGTNLGGAVIEKGKVPSSNDYESSFPDWLNQDPEQTVPAEIRE